MPKVVEEAGYQIVVYSNDHAPAHLHAIKDGKSAKFTLTPVDLIENSGFSEKMIREAIEIIRRYNGHCWKVWKDTHG